MSVTVKGLEKVIHEIHKKAIGMKAASTSRVSVGYSAPYALYVHENMNARHKPPTQAKFLEQPMRDEAVMARVRDTIKRHLLKDSSATAAFGHGGQVLLDASLPLVPVDTGALRDSAYIRVER